MDPQCQPWDDARVKQAATELAALSLAVDSFSEPAEKQAAGWADSLRDFASQASTTAQNAWRDLPNTARNPLLYGGVGALGGGLLGGLSSFARDPEERRPFRSALSGALAGAAGGAGLGLIRDQLPDDVLHSLGLADRPQPGAPTAQVPRAELDALRAQGPLDLGGASDEMLDQAGSAIQAGRDAATRGSANAGLLGAGIGAAAGGAAGVGAADLAVPKYLQHGLNRGSSLLERGAVDLDVDKLYKGRTDAMPQFIRNLNQPGTIAPSQQERILQDAVRKRQILPPEGPGWVPEGQTIGTKVPTKGESPHLPGVAREEIRGLAGRGRALSRAGNRPRAIGGGVGGVVGGLLGGWGGSSLYDWMQGE